MTRERRRSRSGIIPRRRQRHYSYNESLEEPAKLIADEPVAIEEEVPAEEKRPVEGIENDDEADSPAFTE